MSGEIQAAEERFANRSARAALGLFFALIALIGSAMVAEAPTRVSGAVLLAVGALLAVRALKTSVVIVDQSGVTTRSIVRSRRHDYSDLRSVDVGVGRTGFAASGREYLMFHRMDGEQVEFKELNSRMPKTPDDSTLVREAAATIRRNLRRFSEAPEGWS